MIGLRWAGLVLILPAVALLGAGCAARHKVEQLAGPAYGLMMRAEAEASANLDEYFKPVRSTCASIPSTDPSR